MGKKKSKNQGFVLKPWCWYCEREFEDEKVLLQHQKAKHFKCQLCPRKLNTAGGLMVHSQQVHKTDPEPLTNTLPGRDGYDIEIFGMEGVPTNAIQEWKSRKEQEAGGVIALSAINSKRPRNSYNVIPEADLQTALAQHKILMARRNQPGPPVPFPGFPGGVQPPFPPPGMMPPPGMGMPPGFPPSFPPGFPPMPAPTLGGAAPPPGFPNFPPGFRPPFPPPPGQSGSPFPPFPAPSVSPVPPNPNTPAHIVPVGTNSPSPFPPGFRPSPQFAPQGSTPGSSTPMPSASEVVVEILPPKDGVMWPDSTASPAEKRAQQSRYRYTSPTPDGAGIGIETGTGSGIGQKRKAAADFL